MCDRSIHAWPGFRREKEFSLASRFNWKKIIKMSPDATVNDYVLSYVALPVAEPAEESQCHGKNIKFGVRTFECESNFNLFLLLRPWASHSTSYHLHFPFNICPTILKEWSLEHRCFSGHQRVAWVSPTSGFITHLLDEHFWDATSLSPPCDQRKPRHKNSADLWSAMSTIAWVEVLHRSNYILRNVP